MEVLVQIISVQFRFTQTNYVTKTVQIHNVMFACGNHKKEEKTESRLKKVMYVLDHFKRVCKSVYKPKKNVSVDKRIHG